jgi:uncharacterized protein YukE
MTVNVDPGAIRSLAERLRAAADTLSHQTAAFGEQARLQPDALGPLPAGRKASADYAQRLQGALYSLHRLETTLREFVSNLDTSAANWERADHGSIAEGP